MKGGQTRVVGILEDLIGRLEETRSNVVTGASGGPRQEKSPELAGGISTEAPSRFDRLNLHPRISDVAREPFLAGHYWEAVSDGAKALVNYVKERSGHHDIDGAPLVTMVFSPINPILAFNGLANESDLEEQEAMMHLFQGAVLAIRNRAGPSFAADPEMRAIEYLSMLSLLASRLQVVTRRARR